MSNTKYNKTIADGEAMLRRIEAKANRVKGAIETLREMRDAGCGGTVDCIAARISNTELAHYLKALDTGSRGRRG